MLRPYPHSKWIYSACMSWSEKGQLTSQRKQTTARDKLNLTTHLTLHLCELSHIKMDFVFEYAAATHTLCCICPTIQLYLWRFVFASHAGVCHISRWKRSWNKLFCYLRSNLYLVFGCRNLIIWGFICICDRLDLSAQSVFASQSWFITNQDVK